MREGAQPTAAVLTVKRRNLRMQEALGISDDVEAMWAIMMEQCASGCRHATVYDTFLRHMAWYRQERRQLPTTEFDECKAALEAYKRR